MTLPTGHTASTAAPALALVSSRHWCGKPSWNRRRHAWRRPLRSSHTLPCQKSPSRRRPRPPTQPQPPSPHKGPWSRQRRTRSHRAHYRGRRGETQAGRGAMRHERLMTPASAPRSRTRRSAECSWRRRPQWGPRPQPQAAAAVTLAARGAAAQHPGSLSPRRDSRTPEAPVPRPSHAPRQPPSRCPKCSGRRTSTSRSKQDQRAEGGTPVMAV